MDEKERKERMSAIVADVEKFSRFDFWPDLTEPCECFNYARLFGDLMTAHHPVCSKIWEEFRTQGATVATPEINPFFFKRVWLPKSDCLYLRPDRDFVYIPPNASTLSELEAETEKWGKEYFMSPHSILICQEVSHCQIGNELYVKYEGYVNYKGVPSKTFTFFYEKYSTYEDFYDD